MLSGAVGHAFSHVLCYYRAVSEYPLLYLHENDCLAFRVPKKKKLINQLQSGKVGRTCEYSIRRTTAYLLFRKNTTKELVTFKISFDFGIETYVLDTEIKGSI
jgi:hypothetical protein